MRHRNAGRKFSRNTSHRRAMLRALTANLVAHERIETTDAKAKELRRVAERLITRAIRLGPLAYTPHEKLSSGDRARRQAAEQQMMRFLRRFAVVPEGEKTRKIDLIEKVFLELAKRFKDRPGGYTRIVKLGRRRGDNAPMSLVEFVDRADSETKAGGDDKKTKRAAKAGEQAEASSDEVAAGEAGVEPGQPEAKQKKPRKEAASKPRTPKTDDPE
jgi:large subunit ribosomal protein L17